jgi:hypothetical protein
MIFIVINIVAQRIGTSIAIISRAMSPSIKFLSFLVVIVIALGAGWYVVSQRQPDIDGPVTEEVVTDENTKEIDGVLVTQSSVADTGSKLPAGFPRDIPVEQSNITESYRAVYTEHGVTQYTVSYTSNKSRDALWDLYNSYFKSVGYTVEQGSSKTQGQISANKGSDTISVVLSARGGVSLAQISLLDRQ